MYAIPTGCAGHSSLIMLSLGSYGTAIVLMMNVNANTKQIIPIDRLLDNCGCERKIVAMMTMHSEREFDY